MILGGATLFAARPIAIRFMAKEDFARRRNVWIALTATAFLSPNFWWFIAIAVPILLTAGRRDPNPSALYVFLLQVIPPISTVVPIVGVSRLMTIDIYLLLGLFVMLPAALRVRRNPDAILVRRLQLMDYLLIGYGIVIGFYYIHSEIAHGVLFESTITDSTRRIFEYAVSIYVPYFVISRTCITRQLLAEVLAMFTLSCAIMSVIALFEATRGWLVYADLGRSWGIEEKINIYVMRGTTLRAVASAGHSLALGFLLSIAFGFWLYLQRFVESLRRRLCVFALLMLGLLAAYSRGPWIAAVCIYFVFAALNPSGKSKLVKATFVAVVVGTAAYLSPLGARIVSVLPVFGGTVDDKDLDYRRHLINRAWEIVKDNPMLGDQHALLRMQDLRQGQGIIDLVNTYAGVLLGSGFVGLFLFLFFILLALSKAIITARSKGKSDPEFASLGLCLGSCIVGMLLMLENSSLAVGPQCIFYATAGLATAYAAIGSMKKPPSPKSGQRMGSKGA